MSDDKSKIVEVMPPDAEAIRIIVNELRDRCEVIIKRCVMMQIYFLLIY